MNETVQVTAGLKLMVAMGLVAITSSAVSGMAAYRVGERYGATGNALLKAQQSQAAMQFDWNKLRMLDQKSAKPVTGVANPQALFELVTAGEASAAARMAGLGGMGGSMNFANLASMLKVGSQATQTGSGGGQFSGTWSLFGNSAGVPISGGQMQGQDFCKIVIEQSSRLTQTIRRKKILVDSQTKSLQSGRTQALINQTLGQVKTDRLFNDKVLDVNSEELSKLFGQSGADAKGLEDIVAKIRTAVEQYRTTLDAAFKDYQTSVQPKLQPLLTEAAKLAADAEKSIAAAITKAMTDCATGKDAKIVQADFEASLKIWQNKIDDFMKKVQMESKMLTSLLAKYQGQLDGAGSQFQGIVKQIQGQFGSDFLGGGDFFSGGTFPDFSSMKFDYSGLSWLESLAARK